MQDFQTTLRAILKLFLMQGKTVKENWVLQLLQRIYGYEEMTKDKRCFILRNIYKPSQIASNFSRLTYLGKAPHPYREINDDDLLSAISMIDASGAISDVIVGKCASCKTALDVITNNRMFVLHVVFLYFTLYYGTSRCVSYFTLCSILPVVVWHFTFCYAFGRKHKGVFYSSNTLL